MLPPEPFLRHQGDGSLFCPPPAPPHYPPSPLLTIVLRHHPSQSSSVATPHEFLHLHLDSLHCGFISLSRAPTIPSPSSRLHRVMAAGRSTQRASQRSRAGHAASCTTCHTIFPRTLETNYGCQFPEEQKGRGLNWRKMGSILSSPVLRSLCCSASQSKMELFTVMFLCSRCYGGVFCVLRGGRTSQDFRSVTEIISLVHVRGGHMTSIWLS